MYGGRGDRRLLESPERKRNRSLQRFNSETRFQSPGHLMPKMIERRMLRFNSVSNVRKLGNQNRQDKIYRCLDQQQVKQQLNHVPNLQDADSFIQQMQDDLAIPKLKEKFESRNPAGWIKNISGFQFLKNRYIYFKLGQIEKLNGLMLKIDYYLDVLQNKNHDKFIENHIF